MKLTKTTDFALRLLIHLASEQETRTKPVVSKELGISYYNLSKIVQTLAKAQMIHTKQGKNGGIRLLKKADDISLKEVIDVIDGPTNLSDCLTDVIDCKLICSCKLKHVFGDIQNRINDMFEEVTIAQMV